MYCLSKQPREIIIRVDGGTPIIFTLLSKTAKFYNSRDAYVPTLYAQFCTDVHLGTYLVSSSKSRK